MTHGDRALYDVLGGGALVRWLWEGPKPARALVFAATIVAIAAHLAALFVEDVALSVAEAGLEMLS